MNEHTDIIVQLADRAAKRLTPVAETRLNCHLENCPECREAAKRFTRSCLALENVLDGLVSPPLFNGVRERLEHPETRRAQIGWRPVWAGAAVLTLVLAFSTFMSRPMISNEQVMQEYSEDIQILWEGGFAETESSWLPAGWTETTGLESSENGLENFI